MDGGEGMRHEIYESGICPICSEMLVFPRGGLAYCEDCGWPDEDFDGKYVYPQVGEQLGDFQPGLEFYDYQSKKWVKAGIISGRCSENFRGFYRKKEATHEPD